MPAGKVLEYTDAEGRLSDHQFGFRKGRSTVDAIRLVVETTDKALLKKLT